VKFQRFDWAAFALFTAVGLIANVALAATNPNLVVWVIAWAALVAFVLGFGRWRQRTTGSHGR
jgi:hypothetical protein